MPFLQGFSSGRIPMRHADPSAGDLSASPTAERGKQGKGFLLGTISVNFVLKREGYLMNRNRILNETIAILGMIAALVIAYRLDRWLIQARKEAAQTFIFYPVLWGSLAANLIAAAILLLLAWFVFTRLERSISLTIIFLIAGLGVMIYPITNLVWDIPMFSFLARSPFREARAALLEVGFNSLNAFSSAFVVAMGLFNLIPRRRVGS